MHVGLGLHLLVHVGLGGDVVGLHWLLVHVSLGGDLLVDVGLGGDVFMHVRQSLDLLVHVSHGLGGGLLLGRGGGGGQADQAEAQLKYEVDIYSVESWRVTSSFMAGGGSVCV